MSKTLTSAADRKAEAKAKAGKQAAAEGKAAAAENRQLAAREGMLQGIKARERQAAHETLQTAASLANVRPLTEAEAEAAAAAEALLAPSPGLLKAAEQAPTTAAKAEAAEAAKQAIRRIRHARRFGRYAVIDDRRMTAKELTAMCDSAAAAELADRARRGMRLPEARYWELRADVAQAAAAKALEVAANAEARRLFALPWGTVQADRRLAIAHRNAEARNAVMPRWRSPFPADATRGRRRPADDERALWTATLRNYAKHALRGEADYDRAVEAAKLAREQGRVSKADRAADAEQTATALAALLTAAGRPMGVQEAYAVRAMLDGLSHRERGVIDGCTMATATDRAAKGRRQLAKRWNTLDAMRADLAAAKAEAARQSMAEARRNYGPVILHLTPTATLTPVSGPVAAWQARRGMNTLPAIVTRQTVPMDPHRAEMAAAALARITATAKARRESRAEAETVPVRRIGLHTAQAARKAAEAARPCPPMRHRHGRPADVLRWITHAEALTLAPMHARTCKAPTVPAEAWHTPTAPTATNRTTKAKAPMTEATARRIYDRAWDAKRAAGGGDRACSAAASSALAAARAEAAMAA